jgi:glycosyltransferase involved in cell wall biosynthesis
MGYTVWVFDTKNNLLRQQFAWLSLRSALFSICSAENVVARNGFVVTGWITPLIEQGFLDKVDRNRVRYWCHGEALRDGMADARQAVFDMPAIAINNKHIEGHYRRAGYKGDIIHLDNWVRKDLFRPGERAKGSIGYQSDNNVFNMYDTLVDQYPENKIVFCEGTQEQVADKMRGCDLYIAWNRVPVCYSNLGFHGETFGLSMFEAMASGCVVHARAHAGVNFLDGIVPFSTNLRDLRNSVMWTMENENREERRFMQTSLVESQYRFDGRRRYAIKELLQ